MSRTTKSAYHFYPRPPGGGRRSSARQTKIYAPFLSTPSGWRATTADTGAAAGACDFYPRPPGGGRQTAATNAGQSKTFLSTPSGWRATYGLEALARYVTFLSTPSGWRATTAAVPAFRRFSAFLSTPSGWRATPKCTKNQMRRCISIHALRVEGDLV